MLPLAQSCSTFRQTYGRPFLTTLRAASRSSFGSRCPVAARASEDDEGTKSLVADVLKSGVRGSAWVVDTVTDLAQKALPDVDKDTISLAVKAVAVVALLGVANSILSFAFTLGALALAVFVAIQVFDIDVDDVMSAGKKK